MGQGHRVHQTGTLQWCRICGAYGQSRFRDLQGRCTGPARGGPREGQLSRLLAGRHPLTGEFLVVCGCRLKVNETQDLAGGMCQGRQTQDRGGGICHRRERQDRGGWMSAGREREDGTIVQQVCEVNLMTVE